MEKYEQHGLTRIEDELLGALGNEDDISDILEINMLTPEYLKAFRSLIHRDILERRIQKSGTFNYVLTPKGKKLWRIREVEEYETALRGD